MVGYEVIDVPTLRVDPAVWQAEDDGEGRLIAHLRLGDVAVRLEAVACDSAADPASRDTASSDDWLETCSQRTRINNRPYVVTAYDESMVGAVA